jgi:hypothetical protein
MTPSCQVSDWIEAILGVVRVQSNGCEELDGTGEIRQGERLSGTGGAGAHYDGPPDAGLVRAFERRDYLFFCVRDVVEELILEVAVGVGPSAH